MSKNHDLTQKLLKLEVLHFLHEPISLLLHSFQETQKFQSRLQNFRWLLTIDKLTATKLGKCKIYSHHELPLVPLLPHPWLQPPVWLGSCVRTRRAAPTSHPNSCSEQPTWLLSVLDRSPHHRGLSTFPNPKPSFPPWLRCPLSPLPPPPPPSPHKSHQTPDSTPMSN